MTRSERRFHFRGKARAGRRVDLRYAELDDATAKAGDDRSAVTGNIGVGGAFILTDEPLGIGANLRVKITIPSSAEVIETDASVRWIVEPEDDRHGAGMGVKFRRLDVDSLLKLSEYFASLTPAEGR